MNLGMARKPLKVVLDTNIIVSALVFGGRPEEILKIALQREISPITSPLLQAELSETLIKKFNFSELKVQQIEKKLKKICKVVSPSIEIHVSRDEMDNKVLEAAIEGKCTYIITGDKDLLDLKVFKKIKILTPNQFLQIL